MTKQTFLKYCLSCISITFMLVACAPPSITTTALVPAKYHETTQFKTVAVLPFEGKDGKEFASTIEGTLASINIADKQYFTLVDRTVFEKILDEETRLSQSGIVDPKTAAKIGKATGAKGVYTGTITTAQTSDSPYYESREKCSYYQTVYDKKGRAYPQCAQWTTYQVSCTRRVATFSFTPKLVDVELGKIVYSNNISQTSASQACEDSLTPLKSAQEVLEDAKNLAKEMFRKDVAPHYVTFTINLMDSTDGLSKDMEQKFKAGIDFAKKDRLDRACELWGEVRIASPNYAPILYNLGICAEVTGDLDKALDLLKQADKLLGKPDDRITGGLNRVGSKMAQQKKLKEEKE